MLCEEIVTLKQGLTTFCVEGRLFKADMNLRCIVKEEKDSFNAEFSIYEISPKIRVWGITVCFVPNRKQNGYKPYRYYKGWLSNMRYSKSVIDFIYMCANFYRGNEITISIGINYGVFVPYRTICDFIFNFVVTPRNFIITRNFIMCDNKITWCNYKVKYNIFSPCKLSRN